MTSQRDHGGGLDAARAQHGGSRAQWLDLSTGINPMPYPVGTIPPEAWTALPDRDAVQRLEQAARRFWNVPDEAQVIAAPGASALIAAMPSLIDAGAYIPGPTYNEHAAAFAAHLLLADSAGADAHVYVHPNNPDGRMLDTARIGGRPYTVIDESFCDVMPEASHIPCAADQGVIVLKSFGKFWGLAGLRLGFAIARPETFTPGEWIKLPFKKERYWAGRPAMADLLGPWAVSGPALEIGARALEDHAWAEATRARLSRDTARLDRLMARHGALVGGTTLFRLYDVGDAAAFQEHLARHHIWSRIFPYSDRWLRLGLPAPDRWAQLEGALA